MVDFKKLLKKQREAQASRSPAPKPQKGRLPVARGNAPALLAGRGEKNLVPSVSELGDEIDGLADAAAEIAKINIKIAKLEEDKDTYKLIVEQLMSDYRDDQSWSVRSDDDSWIATRIVPKETKKLVPELLVVAGVTAKQLAKGYKTVPAKKPYVQVRTKGQKAKENEEHE